MNHEIYDFRCSGRRGVVSARGPSVGGDEAVFPGNAPSFSLQSGGDCFRMKVGTESAKKSDPDAPRISPFFARSQESRPMLLEHSGSEITLAQQVESRVRET